MPSAVSVNKMKSRVLHKLYDHDPSTATSIVTPDGGTTLRTVDFSEMASLEVQGFSTNATFTEIEIIASAQSDMSSPEIIATTGTVTATNDAPARVECTAAQVAEVSGTSGKKLRYVAGRITANVATAEGPVTYVGIPLHARDGLN
jgi:hypothetical protein